MLCFRNVTVNTLHKGGEGDDNDDKPSHLDKVIP
jgi:hypothetical protein